MSSNLFEIRRLGLDDVADFRSIRLAALKQAPEAFGSSYDIEVLRSLPEFSARLAGSMVFAAYLENTIVGMVGLKLETGQKDSHKGFIWGMYVQSEARQRGIGEALLLILLEAADELVEQVTLTAVKENVAAISLYQKLGFEIYGTEPRSMKSAGVYQDEVMMLRFLRSSPARA